MKILVITQKVDKKDSILGFFYGWIKELSRHSKVTCICLYKGVVENDIPFDVYSLGKETGNSKISYLINFYKYIFKKRKDYDAVFVHMNQIYVILGWPIWKILNKRIFLWYAHGKVSRTLRLANFLVDGVFTSTREGYRIESKKKHIVGQGIDVSIIPYAERSFDRQIVAMSVGRLSPVKDLDTFILGFGKLIKEKLVSEIVIVGGAETADQEKYKNHIKELIHKLGLDNKVNIVGSLANEDAKKMLLKGHLFINASLTGSLDKSGLEAMASGMPVFTCNEAYIDIFGKYTDVFIFSKQDPQSLSEKVERYLALDQKKKEEMAHVLRKKVEEEHSITQLMKKIYDVMSSCQ